MTDCFHCGQDVPKNIDLSVKINNQVQPMCCPGCQAVAQAIVDSGNESFYTYRTDLNETPEFTLGQLPPSVSEELALYDNPDVLKELGQQVESGQRIQLMIEGITCAACAWLIEQQLQRLPGVKEANLNLTQHRLSVTWEQNQTPLRQVIETIYSLGFKAQPFETDTFQQQLEEEQKRALRRVLLAGLGTMQAMMFAVPLYIGELAGILEKFELYFRFAGMAITTPVILISARPFFKGFIRDIKTKHLTMDVPVSIAIGGAFIASIYSTFVGGEEVYFDSVCMFTFFLLVGRYFETRARLRTGEAGNQLNNVLPRSVTRITTDDEKSEAVIPVNQLNIGDRIRVLPGATIAADGIIQTGHSSVDESIMTGEFLPIHKDTGDQVLAGSLNVENPIEIEVTALGDNTQLSTVMSLLDRAESEKPRMAIMADVIAQYFVGAVLILAAIVFTAWYFIDTDRAFWITLSVLVATCPCALSLATPTALTAATGALRKAGVLITRGHVLESLTQSKRIIFDKTGTLTLGQLSIESVSIAPETELDQTEALAIASALESHSQHPIANAFQALSLEKRYVAEDINMVVGQGIEGKVNGQLYRIGHQGFAAIDSELNPDEQRQQIFLSADDKAIARFVLSDQLRPGSQHAVSSLNQQGIITEMLSGDHSYQVEKIAKELKLQKAQGSISPQGKLDYLSGLNNQDHSIMVGDGINDVPVLARAPISIAVGSASDLAKTHADVILLNQNLKTIAQLLQHARKAKRIIRQNLSWALLYNTSVLPLAAAGLLPPWAAAIGMSASSLIVVFNALRLNSLAKL
ncbi:cadmium-translocating P-type ATPase [Bermanella marisrubri]|uniref:P-type Cu(2+) transporter n=1 Tax=Bermanella marisrubri TaxID=207949 RepID=Q1N680_9GAMM|nr:heavy metal translocating P-type ATPase [Bermanella marisrubri]EAT13712.1 copper-translocating P-type ATPase [Oceanobacter sp. RED65] [Bermanella marisrubri]QIZ84488.1 cadmium-translocating P-type ATPase [Bermanella marisrubri]